MLLDNALRGHYICCTVGSNSAGVALDPYCGEEDMAKLGPYSYPDIRFGDAVEIAGRILAKFKGVVSVKGLAWELGMAEGSGTLFAKVAALRDFGFVEGRGELRITPLAQRVLHPSSSDEGQSARGEAFQRVELLRQLYVRFEGEVPDDMSLLVGIEELTKASRDEIVRRAPLIQKHLTDAVRVLGRPGLMERKSEYSGLGQNILSGRERAGSAVAAPTPAGGLEAGTGIELSAGGRTLSVPLSAEYIDVAIGLLATLKTELAESEDDFDIPASGEQDAAAAADLEFGATDQLDV